ncbi:MAG: Uricase (urate oxidase) [uncultured Thermoleophilia bacterium]|uniref:Uricase n=1 Tax=uncultured Thermoleophilia bacterium TaxID=1497501 RepID=A0A6J4UQE6_9ACTN|nr:MAG: Uricase (urate oxidase) [uncultured Thermoleophilia bacterium]
MRVPGAAYRITYGKAGVPVHRVHAPPLRGLRAVPESAATGRPNVLFAHEIDVEVFGDNFLPAYTEGDNSTVVATDSMKNFILRLGLDSEASTLEGYLDDLGRRLLATYAQMEGVRVAGRELRFDAVPVPDGDGGFRPSDVLFSRHPGDHGVAVLRFGRVGDEVVAEDARGGRAGLELVKITGSAFTQFVRDGWTTLPERRDRPLFIGLDVGWRYLDPADASGRDPTRYVASEQVRDVVAAVFEELVSESIQHLVNDMGARVLERFGQLAEVSFDARNMTRDPVAVSDTDDRVRVYSDPFPAFGTITLTLRRQRTRA